MIIKMLGSRKGFDFGLKRFLLHVQMNFIETKSLQLYKNE